MSILDKAAKKLQIVLSVKDEERKDELRKFDIIILNKKEFKDRTQGIFNLIRKYNQENSKYL